MVPDTSVRANNSVAQKWEEPHAIPFSRLGRQQWLSQRGSGQPGLCLLSARMALRWGFAGSLPAPASACLFLPAPA